MNTQNAKPSKFRGLHVSAFACVLLAFGLLLWARFIIVTGHPRTAIAEPPKAQQQKAGQIEKPKANVVSGVQDAAE